MVAVELCATRGVFPAQRPAAWQSVQQSSNDCWALQSAKQLKATLACLVVAKGKEGALRRRVLGRLMGESEAPPSKESLDVPALQIRLTAQQSRRIHFVRRLNLISQDQPTAYVRGLVDKDLAELLAANNMTVLDLDRLIADESAAETLRVRVPPEEDGRRKSKR